MTIRWFAALTAVPLLGAGLGVPPASAVTTPVSPTTVDCVYTSTPEEPPARPVTPPPPTAVNTGETDLTFTTNQGAITVTLNRAAAPCAVHSLTHLATAAFYDDTVCHRLTTHPRLGVIQCGDPSATGSGGPGYRFDDELTGGETYPRGTLAMANAGRNTNGSQFFLVHGAAQLRPDYVVLGHVRTGLDVLDRIAAIGVKDGGQDGPPARTVGISTVTP